MQPGRANRSARLGCALAIQSSSLTQSPGKRWNILVVVEFISTPDLGKDKLCHYQIHTVFTRSPYDTDLPGLVTKAGFWQGKLCVASRRSPAGGHTELPLPARSIAANSAATFRE